MLTDQARDLTIRTILGEAGQESPDGWAAVAHVIKNRADSGRWGDPFNGGLTQTILAPKQFSLWNPGNAAGDLARRATPNDPAYQRIGSIVDQVFNGSPDLTNGATHYYAPAGMPGGQPPDWASRGSNVQQIGNHVFMTLPLGQGATQSQWQQPTTQWQQPQPFAPGSRVPVGMMHGTMPDGTPFQIPQYGTVMAQPNADQSRAYLASLSEHPGRPGDTSMMHPLFATRLAGALVDANQQGLNLHLMSGWRAPEQTGSAYDAAGNSSHSYGIAADIGGLDGPNGQKTQAWAQIAAAHGLSNPYGISNHAEFNHWQLTPYPLETNPQLLQTLKNAYATGDMQAVWNAVPIDQNGYVPEHQGAQPHQVPVGSPPSAQPSYTIGGTPQPPVQGQAIAPQGSPTGPINWGSMMMSAASAASSPPPPPPPTMPQTPNPVSQLPVESPGIQSPATQLAPGDMQVGADQPVPSGTAPAGARLLDPFRYRRM